MYTPHMYQNDNIKSISKCHYILYITPPAPDNPQQKYYLFSYFTNRNEIWQTVEDVLLLKGSSDYKLILTRSALSYYFHNLIGDAPAR